MANLNGELKVLDVIDTTGNVTTTNIHDLTSRLYIDKLTKSIGVSSGSPLDSEVSDLTSINTLTNTSLGIAKLESNGTISDDIINMTSIRNNTVTNEANYANISMNSNTAYSAAVTQAKLDEKFNRIQLTEAEYLELKEAGELDPETLYIISDRSTTFYGYDAVIKTNNIPDDANKAYKVYVNAANEDEVYAHSVRLATYSQLGSKTYEGLPDKPSINNLELVGSKSGHDYGLVNLEDLGGSIETYKQNISFPTDDTVRSFYNYNNTLYVGTLNHGIYTSTDGVTFTQNISFPTDDTVNSFIEFNNILYVGTLNHGIYTSTDGVTFTQNISFPNYTVNSFIEFNNILYVGTFYYGIYTSTDGVTFTQNISFPTNYTVNSFIEFNNILYVGSRGHGIYTSSDGVTFTQNTSFPTNHVYSFIEFNNILYVGSNHGIYTSIDGITFTQISNDRFPTNYLVLSVIEFNNTLYVGTERFGIYTSIDGITFTQISNDKFPITYTTNSFIEFNNTLYVGTSSHGIYTFTPILITDSVPTANSEKIMKSGAIYDSITKINSESGSDPNNAPFVNNIINMTVNKVSSSVTDVSNGSTAGTINVTINGSTTAVKVGDYTTSIRLNSSISTPAITLNYGEKYELTAGGKTTTFQMPLGEDTDENLKQVSNDTSTSEVRVLLTTNANTSTITSSAIKSNKLTYVPSTGKLKATSFNVNGGATIQYNASSQSIEFVF
jgi:hypothetical protein